MKSFGIETPETMMVPMAEEGKCQMSHDVIASVVDRTSVLHGQA